MGTGKRSVRAVATLATAAAATMGSGAAAQSLSASGLTFGVPTRELEVVATGDVLYDTNVARGRSARSLRGLQKADARFSPGAQVNLSLPTGPAQFGLVGIVAYDFYARNTQLDRERIDLTATAGVQPGPCAAAAQGGYARRQIDLVDLSIEPGNPRLSSVNVQTVKSVSGTLSCGAEVGIRPTGYVGYRELRNSTRRLQNFNATTYGGGLSYSNPAFGILTAYVGKAEFDYTDRDGFDGIYGITSFDATVAGLRLDRRLGARLQVNGEISYTKVDLPPGYDEDYDGINWNVAATFRATPQLQLSAAASRLIDASGGFNANFARTTFLSLRADYAVTAPLHLSVTASHRARDFQVDRIVPGRLLTDDKVNEVAALFTYRRGRRVSFNTGLAYQRRDASLDIYEYDSVRISAGVSVRL